MQFTAEYIEPVCVVRLDRTFECRCAAQMLWRRAPLRGAGDGFSTGNACELPDKHSGKISAVDIRRDRDLRSERGGLRWVPIRAAPDGDGFDAARRFGTRCIRR